MIYRNLGKTGLKVSALSFGSWLTFAKQIDEGIADKLMGVAYDHGVNFFDNAEIYASGGSEKVMGQILKNKKWDRTSYLVSSKVFFGDGRKLPNQTGLSRKHVVEACHDALKRLQLDYLDLYFCHRPDKSTPIEETVWTMHNLIQQGKILYWGTSEWSAAEIMEAHMVAHAHHLIGPVTEQSQYNMLVRQKVEVEYQTIYKSVGLGNTIWSPLASGILTDKYAHGIPSGTRLDIEGLEWLRNQKLTEENLKLVRQLSVYAKGLGLSLANLAIAWCLRNPNVSTVILGASAEVQLLENLRSIELLEQLTAHQMDEIEAILNNKPIPPQY
ncbi:MAG: aldo/keto reductase [Saprospiraceae bacterium]|nr:aldo/keto reductase [Saprospiraceae bacterium]HMW38027.1 aldo/keto reductase [Saprospiraceae bacterium]HMX86989.1 aldo/keto reductase [Saprospiraceae bacterium]HMZ39832.1 aldo/keto reductase [Saprospiraceae bacterium]HNA64307.1 aldo/keto reductase [Saprospiraceae bacterium]